MNEDWMIQSVSSQIYRQYPEFKGIRPEVHWSPDSTSNRCTLIFKTSIKTETGKKLIRRVKAVCSADGKIQKVTSSK